MQERERDRGKRERGGTLENNCSFACSARDLLLFRRKGACLSERGHSMFDFIAVGHRNRRLHVPSAVDCMLYLLSWSYILQLITYVAC